jgi:hypothetical protein
MSFNLNSPTDFAALTLSGASSILNQFTGLNNEQWDIQEGAYVKDDKSLVKFLVFKTPENYNGAVDSIQDTIARRVVPFKYPYVDGQTTEDMGREGSHYEFDILLFGKNYYSAYTALLAQMNTSTPGVLIHPVLGRIQAKFKEAIVTHRSSVRQAVALKATFYEHNFDISFKSPVDSTKSKLADAVAFISKISNVITAVQSNLAVLSTVRNIIGGKLGTYQADYTATLVAMNTTFNNGSSSDIPGLLPNNSSANSSFSVASAQNDIFSNISPTQIQAQQSPALASLQAINRVSANRVLALDAISAMESANSGEGSLIYYDEITTLKQSAAAMQGVLQLGIQSSNSTIKNYKVPRLMSVREVCFLNGISVDRSYEIETLNPTLLSMNYIEEGTVVQVPSS